MKRTFLVSFLTVAALGLLVAFALNSRPVPLEAHLAQNTISSTLEDARRNFATIVSTLSDSAAAGSEPPEAIATLHQSIIAAPAAAGTQLSSIPGSTSSRTRMANAHAGFTGSVEVAGELLDELIEKQTAFGASVAFLRESGPEIIERMRDIALTRPAADAFQLIVGTLEFAEPGNTTAGTELRRLHATLARDQQLDANMPAESSQLLDAAAVILQSRDDIRSLLEQISGSSLPTNATALEDSVGDAYLSAVAGANSARTLLAVYAIALFLAVGFVGFRLRSSYAAINHANSELEVLNESLEQRVQERTAELSTALSELKESQVQLVQAEKMSSLGQLVAGISHEINTPLLYLANNAELISERIDLMKEFVGKCAVAFALDRKAYADRAEYQSKFINLLLDVKTMLREEELEAATEEARDLMRDSIDGLNDLTEMAQSLKDFSRLDRAPVSDFDINAGIDKTLLIARNIVKDKAEVHRYFGDIPTIRCSPSKLNQVFLNLISNAAQAIDGRGEIVIRTSMHDEDHVAIGVSDSGCGISEENLAKIRDPFFTTKDVGSGTGLGLSIVEEIVRGHGGVLEIESEEGKGSTFTVILPLDQTAVADPGMGADPDVGADAGPDAGPDASAPAEDGARDPLAEAV